MAIVCSSIKTCQISVSCISVEKAPNVWVSNVEGVDNRRGLNVDIVSQTLEDFDSIVAIPIWIDTRNCIRMNNGVYGGSVLS